jgi:hypothetical protein
VSNVGCIVATSVPAIVSIDTVCFHRNSVAETTMVVIGTTHVVCGPVAFVVTRIFIVCVATIVVTAIDSTKFMTCVCCAT